MSDIQLAKKIQAWRKANGLPAIPFSLALQAVKEVK